MLKTLPPPPTTTRAPGQHLDETIREEFEWKYFYFGGGASAFVLSAAMVWFAWLTDRHEYVPWAATLLAGWAVVYLVWWVIRTRSRVHAWKYGLRGEREVAAVLGDLGRLGYIVRHDIQCEKDGRRWNIDHLVIGPTGVYVVETKWKTKAREGSGITFDGDCVRFDDGTWDDGSIEQVRRNVRDVRAQLEKAGLGEVPVRGVVCYPGAGRVGGSSGRDIWVLKPEALEKWIRVEEGKVARVGEERQKTVVAVVCG